MKIKIFDKDCITGISDDGRSIAVNFECENNTIYILNSSELQFYTSDNRCLSTYRNKDKHKLWLSVTVCDISDSAFDIFKERVRYFCEPRDVSEIFDKFSRIDRDALQELTMRSVERLFLPEKELNIARAIFSGISKRQLIDEGYCTLDEIESCEQLLRHNIKDYDYPEYIKAFLTERINSLSGGQEELLYTDDSFSRKYNIPQEIIYKINLKIITGADFLTEDDIVRLRNILNDAVYIDMTGDDKTFFSKTCETIVHKYIARERAYYNSVARSLIKDGKCLYGDVFRTCQFRCLNYRKLNHCIVRMVGRRNIIVPRCNEHLREYLDE